MDFRTASKFSIAFMLGKDSVRCQVARRQNGDKLKPAERQALRDRIAAELAKAGLTRVASETKAKKTKAAKKAPKKTAKTTAKKSEKPAAAAA